MKRLVYLFAVILIPAFTNAQNGVYMSLQDFKNHKLSKECEFVGMEYLMGKYSIIIENGKNKEKIALKGSRIWGFRRGICDYRVIDDLPHCIATKGAIWYYSGADDKIMTDKEGDTCYYKDSNAYPYASKGLDGPLVKLNNNKDLLKLMDTKGAEDVLDKAKKFWLSIYGEDWADYYNSTRPGFLSTRYKKIFYGGINHTANGHRPVSF